MPWSTKKIIGVVFVVLFFLSLVLGGGVFLIVRTVVGAIKNSEPYRVTEELARDNPVVMQNLGLVKKFGWFPMGSNIKVENEKGEATISVRVYGEKGKGRVRTSFAKDGEKWFLSDARLFVSGQPEGIPLLPLEISSITFHSESEEGPVNEARKYASGETIYWTVVVENAHERGGEVSLREGIRILNEQNEIVLEDPDLVVTKDKSGDSAVVFKNNATPPAEGLYTFRVEVEDRFSNRQAVRADTVRVVAAEGIRVSHLVFHDGGPAGPVKNDARYALGEAVHLTFDVLGMGRQGGRISVSQDLIVRSEAGEPVLDKPRIISLNEEWLPDEMLTLNNRIDLPDAGNYEITILVRDRLSEQHHSTTAKVSIKKSLK